MSHSFAKVPGPFLRKGAWHLLILIVLLSFCEQAIAKPSRIVSINLCSDEILLRLADPNRIAAVTWHATDPKLSSVVDLAKDLKTTHGTAEEVLILDPDLVLAGWFTTTQTTQLLRKLGYEVYLVRIPKNFEELYEQIREISEKIEEIERGESLIQSMKERLQKLKATHSGNPSALFYWPGGVAAGYDSMINALIEAAGARNVADKMGLNSNGIITLEKLIVANPEVLIFSNYHIEVPTVGKQMLSHPAIRRGSSSMQQIVLPSQLLSCSSPATVDAAELLSEKNS